MRGTRFLFCLAVASFVISGTKAQAHFIWLDPGKPGSGEAAVRVYFSETAEPGDPALLDRVQQAQVWRRTLDGGFRLLEPRRSEDALVADGIGRSPAVIGLAHTYGVITRGNETFLLKYYAKTFRGGDLAAWVKFKPAEELPLEIMPHLDGKKLELAVLWKGKPLSDAELVIDGPGLSPVKDKTDGQGRFTCILAEPGLYSIRARQVEDSTGTREGKEYASVRHYSTLTLPFATHTAASNAQPGDTDAGARMSAAHKARADWGAKFPGFNAKLEVNLDGRVYSGSVKVSRNGDTKVELPDADAQKWAQMNFQSTVMHRNPGEDREYSEDAYSHYRFVEAEESHPLGRLIADNESGTRSTYRIRDNQILEVHRETEKTHFTISVLENARNSEGRYLPRNYTVTFWNAETGKVERASTTHDEWTRVGDFDLPKHTVVVTSSDGKRQVRQLTLREHRLLETTSPAVK